MKRPRLPRCKGIDRRGVRCGRSAATGLYCHLHQPRIIEVQKVETNGPERQHDQPTGTSTVAPEPPAVSTDSGTDAESADEDEQVATAQSAIAFTPLAPDLYRKAGLIKLRDDRGRAIGDWTHPLGDEHAAKIMSGEIPFEDAHRDHNDATRHLMKWAESYFPKEKRVSYV